MRGGKRRRLACATLALAPLATLAQCPNQCSSKGTCDKYGRCTCFEGYTAADCSQLTCPMSYAWTDSATADDRAHAKAECSNRGLCDRASGMCTCMNGFVGKACERMACDYDCYGRGKCLSMRTLASSTYSDNSDRFIYDAPWDADKVFGCVCDAPYTTYHCGQRDCPTGDDPLTMGQTNEVQLIKCMASQGKFALLFDGKPTADIFTTYNEAQLKAAIEEAATVDEVAIRFSVSGGMTCQTNTINIIEVEFLQNFGSLPPLLAATEALSGTVQISADGRTPFVDSASNSFVSVKGSKEDDICSNRGICDVFTATCTCMDTNSDSYASSNGYGAKGDRGDCGYAVSATSTCPGEVECSDQGVCDPSTYRCACAEGWYGADCSLKACPSGESWFSYPSANNRGHDTRAVCSDGGVCDTTTGLCTCSDKFFGAACEYMACPGGMSNKCNGHGECRSMAELALNAHVNGDATDFEYGTDPNNANTWDAHRIFGCECDPGWTGYDCSLRTCPSGDDPGTYGQVNEKQLFECIGTSGTFALSFRQHLTKQLAFDATAADVEAALEALASIIDVDVTFGHGTSACIASTGTTNTIAVQFKTEHGDVPKIIPDITYLVNSDYGTSLGTGTISIYSDGEVSNGVVSVRGTTEEDECSNRGICDRLSGVCECFRGYASSNGLGKPGIQGDCGYRGMCSLGDAWCDSYK